MSYGKIAEAYIEVRADFAQFNLDINKKTTEELRKAQKEADSFGARLKTAFGGGEKAAESFRKALLPAVGALTAIGFAAKKAIDQAVTAQSEQLRLAKLLETTGGGTPEQIKLLNEQAKAISRVGVASEGAITTLQSQLATFDLQAETIRRLTPAIVDYVIAEKGATASADDFRSATNGLAQALNGNFTSLTQVGFVLDDNTKNLIKNGTEAERSAALVEVLNSTYEGFNETLGKTPEGQAVILKNQFAELQQEIGTKLLPVFNALLTVMSAVVSFASQNTAAVVALGAAIATLAGIIVGVNAGMKIYNTVATLTKGINLALGSSFTKLQVSMGVLGAVLAAATTVYFLLNGRKKESVDVTNDLAAALKAEGDAQKEALAAAVAANPAFGGLLDTLTAQGVSLYELEQNLGRGTKGLQFIADALIRAQNSGQITFETFRQYYNLLLPLSKQLTVVADAQQLVNNVLENQPDPEQYGRRWKNSLSALRKSLGLPEFVEKKTASGMTAAEKAAEKLKRQLDKLRDSVRSTFKVAMSEAREKLDEARQAFTDFANQVASSIKSSLSFGQAQADAIVNTESLTDAISAQADAQAALDEAQNQSVRSSDAVAAAQQRLKSAQDEVDRVRRTGSGLLSRALELQGKAEKELLDLMGDAAKDSDILAEAQRKLAAATNDVTAAQQKPMTFFESLNEQANKATRFGQLVQDLIGRGLNESALQQVLNAGVDAGTAIAEELLNGADNTLIAEANRISDALDIVATQTGQLAAQKFRSQGVIMGEQLVAGISDAIKKYRIELKSKGLTAAQIKKLRKDFAVEIGFNLSTGELPALANGAIVRRPTTALIGESGAEVVVPITRPARALELLEASGLAALARTNGGSAVSIQNATFQQPTDVDLLAQKINAAAIARSLIS